MGDVGLRPVRPGDGEERAWAWVDAGRHYAATVPDVIQEPDREGLADWFERLVAEHRAGEDPAEAAG